MTCYLARVEKNDCSCSVHEMKNAFQTFPLKVPERRRLTACCARKVGVRKNAVCPGILDNFFYVKRIKLNNLSPMRPHLWNAGYIYMYNIIQYRLCFVIRVQILCISKWPTPLLENRADMFYLSWKQNLSFEEWVKLKYQFHFKYLKFL